MAWWGKVWALVSGNGGVVAAVDDGLKLGLAVTAQVHDNAQNVAGQDAVLARENAEKAEINAKVAEVAVATGDSAAAELLRLGRA